MSFINFGSTFNHNLYYKYTYIYNRKYIKLKFIIIYKCNTYFQSIEMTFKKEYLKIRKMRFFVLFHVNLALKFHHDLKFTSNDIVVISK